MSEDMKARALLVAVMIVLWIGVFVAAQTELRVTP